MSEAGTSGGSSPLNISHSSSADSPAGSDDLDAQPDKNEQSQGDPKKKDARDARTDRKKQSKQSRKRNRAAVEEGEEEDSASTILKTLCCSLETETQNSTKARKPRK